MNSKDLKNLILRSFNFDFQRLYFAVPDIHARADIAKAVLTLFEDLNVKNAVWLGDYIDKGPDSLGTVLILMTAQKRHPEYVFLKGNHEMLWVDSFIEGVLSPIEENNLPRTVTSKEAQKCFQFFSSLQLYFEIENLIFAHGGIGDSINLPIDQVPEQELLWTYDFNPRYKGKAIARGHDLINVPTEFENNISVETGGWLPDRDFCISILADIQANRKLLGYLQLNRFNLQQVKLTILNDVRKFGQ